MDEVRTLTGNDAVMRVATVVNQAQKFPLGHVNNCKLLQFYTTVRNNPNQNFNEGEVAQRLSEVVYGISAI